ncbi:MAG: AIR synthase related protein, partial [Acidobacteriota bacterium]|nr:AIR synthase related protein [Acidobacteriota bacterium]
LLSESQERMLIVAKKGREKELVEIFSKWDLDAVVIGKVVEGNRFKVLHNGELMADLPVDKLTDEAPLYERPMAKPGIPDNPAVVLPDAATLDERDFDADLRTLLSAPNICSKRFVYEQYDHMVRTNTAVLPGADAGVVRIKETRRAVAMCLDGNGRVSAINPKEGAKLTVAEAARNNVCVGAKPIAVTNCLNFASPERPKIMWAFSETIDGMKEACEMFETPVISGNVSFYNETDGDGVLPTPTIGMVGVIEDVRKIVTQGFKNEGDVIAILGPDTAILDGGEFAQTVLGMTTEEMIAIGKVPTIDLETEKRVQATCLDLADKMLINSAHDCSDGGLAITLAEQCFSSLNDEANGASVEIESAGGGACEAVFGEWPSRIVISFPEKNRADIEDIAASHGCPFSVIGRVEGSSLSISVNREQVITSGVAEMEESWKTSLEDLLDAKG